jgi:hypothetical protein
MQQLTEREEKKLSFLTFLRQEAVNRGKEFAWYDLQYYLCKFSGGELDKRSVNEEKALIGINDVFYFMQDTMKEEDKKVFVKKVLSSLNGEPCIWGDLLPIVKEQSIKHRDPMKWNGNGRPFRLPRDRTRKQFKNDVSTQADLQYSMPIFPILAISASVLILQLVYHYAK